MDKEKGVVVGVDIGSDKICALAGTMDSLGNLNIESLAEYSIHQNGGVTNGTVVNVDRTAEVISRVLGQLSEGADINVEFINVNISGENVEGRVHHSSITRGDGKSVQPSDVESLAIDIRRTFQPSAGKTLVHTLPQEFFVNNIRVDENPVGRVGIKLGGDFYAISAPHDTIENISEMVGSIDAILDRNRRVPLQIVNMMFSPLADSLALLSDTDKKVGVAVVNIGGDTTEVAIFHRKGLRHIAVIPYAGNSITNDLVEGCQIMPEQAEMLKLVYGTTPSDKVDLEEVVVIPGIDGIPDREVSAKNAALIIEERLKEIAAIVMGEIIKAGYERQLISGIVLTGGSANLPIIVDIFKKVCSGVNVRVGNPMRFISNSKIASIVNPKYSTVVGLMLSSYKSIDTRVPDSVVMAEIPTHVSMHAHRNVVQSTSKREPAPAPKKPFSGFMDRIKDFMNDQVKGDSYNS